MIELKLRALREDHELTQTSLAELLQIHQTTCSDNERGKLNIPLAALDRLADFFGVSVDDLPGRTEIQTPYPRKKR